MTFDHFISVMTHLGWVMLAKGEGLGQTHDSCQVCGKPGACLCTFTLSLIFYHLSFKFTKE